MVYTKIVYVRKKMRYNIIVLRVEMLYWDNNKTPRISSVGSTDYSRSIKKV